MNIKINTKIKELGLIKLEGYRSYAYIGDSYKDKQEDLYCIINSIDNEHSHLEEGEHLYKITTFAETMEVMFTLIA